MTDYPPVDIALLVQHVVDSGSDLDDGLGGYSGGSFDADSGVLTLTFNRDEDLKDAAQNDQWGYVHGSAEYRFQLIPENSGEISDGFHTFNELYRYRLLYNAALFNAWALSGFHDVYKSERHHDGELAFGGGWFVVTAQLPTGQISNHYPLSEWELFDIPERDKADRWDGHTPAEAADRMLRCLRPSPF